MSKTHFRAKLCKQKLPTPHRALLKHLKENTRSKSASARRVNSPVKRLFTAAHSHRLKPLDSGYVCFFFLLLLPAEKCLLFFFLQGWKNVSRGLGGQIRVELTLPCTTFCVSCSTAPWNGCVHVIRRLEGDLLKDEFVIFGGYYTLRAEDWCNVQPKKKATMQSC